MKRWMLSVMPLAALICLMTVRLPAQCTYPMAEPCCHHAQKDAGMAKTRFTSVMDSIMVYGCCCMCRARIEKAAKSVKGVVCVCWNQKTHMLRYSHTGKVKKENISMAINKAGHDTGLGRAPDDVYNSLPACCRYR